MRRTNWSQGHLVDLTAILYTRSKGRIFYLISFWSAFGVIGRNRSKSRFVTCKYTSKRPALRFTSVRLYSTDLVRAYF
jgi:hypothetical protein